MVNLPNRHIGHIEKCSQNLNISVYGFLQGKNFFFEKAIDLIEEYQNNRLPSIEICFVVTHAIKPLWWLAQHEETLFETSEAEIFCDRVGSFLDRICDWGSGIYIYKPEFKFAYKYKQEDHIIYNEEWYHFI